MSTPMPLIDTPYLSPDVLINAPTGIDLGLVHYSSGR
jgi:hypothetical protein